MSLIINLIGREGDDVSSKMPRDPSERFDGMVKGAQWRNMRFHFAVFIF
jgi:hypothetical protein